MTALLAHAAKALKDLHERREIDGKASGKFHVFQLLPLPH